MSTLEPKTDNDIVELTRKQDKQAFAELIRRYEKKLLRYARYLLSDDTLAEDAVQEGFIKAYVNLQSFNTTMKFSSWIYRIVHNEAMTLAKKQKKHLGIDEAIDVDDAVDLEDAYIKKELETKMQYCLTQISLSYREPLILYFLEDKSYEEISDVLRIPIGTVGTRINRAKKIVRAVCQKNQ